MVREAREAIYILINNQTLNGNHNTCKMHILET